MCSLVLISIVEDILPCDESFVPNGSNNVYDEFYAKVSFFVNFWDFKILFEIELPVDFIRRQFF